MTSTSSTTARRVVAITGAGGTLGAALSRRFAGEPDTDVVLSDLSDDMLAATMAGLPDPRGRFRWARVLRSWYRS